jgi:hypothetical protein
MSVRIHRVVFVLVGLAAMSRAAAVPVLIDFTDARWSSGQGEISFSQTYGSLDVTLQSGPSGSLTFNASDASGSMPEFDFLALHGDGIGIGDDEISLGEWLNVTFSANVTVLSYYLLDLFADEGPNGLGELALASFAMSGPDTGYLDIGTATHSAGFYAREGLTIGDVAGISFSTAYGFPTALWDFSDFALAGIMVDDGIEAVSVPEPGTLGLLGLGLAGLFTLGRRGRTVLPS